MQLQVPMKQGQLLVPMIAVRAQIPSLARWQE